MGNEIFSVMQSRKVAKVTRYKQEGKLKAGP